MACLDTSALLDLTGRGGRRKQADAQAKLRQLDHDRPHCTTRFTLAELLVGFELARDPNRERVAYDRIIDKLEILEFDNHSMRAYARIFVHLQSIGRLSGTMDILIASVALTHGRRLLTRNAQHFLDVPGLRVDSYL